MLVIIVISYGFTGYPHNNVKKTYSSLVSLVKHNRIESTKNTIFHVTMLKAKSLTLAGPKNKDNPIEYGIMVFSYLNETEITAS